MHPPGIGQINIAPLRGLLRCAHSGRRELNRFCTYVKLIDGHSSRLSVQFPGAYLCAKDRQAINVPIVSACDSGTHRGPRIGIKKQYHSCDFAPVSTERPAGADTR
jgi:hypothetical protein